MPLSVFHGGGVAEGAKLRTTGLTSDLLHLTQEHFLGVSHQAETSDLFHLTQERILGASYRDEEIEMEIRAGRPNFHFNFRRHILRLTAADGIYTNDNKLGIPAAPYLG